MIKLRFKKIEEEKYIFVVFVLILTRNRTIYRKKEDSFIRLFFKLRIL